MELRGARYLHVLVPCPLGWGIGRARHDPDRAARDARRACSRCSRPRRGEVTAVSKIRRQRAGRGLPAAAAPLRPPVRRPAAHRRDRQDPGARRPQHRRFGLLADAARREARAVMDKPFAITLDVGVEPREQDRLAGAPSAPVYVDRLPPCNDACPAGENIQQWLYRRRGGRSRLRARLAGDHGGQPASRRSWAGSATTRARPPATAASSTRRSGSTRSSASSATRRSREGWRVDGRPRSPAASGCWSSAPGPRGCRRPTTSRALGHAVTIREAGPLPGGMMRFGIPTLPAAARRPRRRGRSGSSTSA